MTLCLRDNTFYTVQPSCHFLITWIMNKHLKMGRERGGDKF